MNDEISTLDQLGLYAEWEEKHNPELNGKKHVARWAVEEIGRLQAKIDALMLEYCPEEMAPEQVENWALHQRSHTNAR